MSRLVCLGVGIKGCHVIPEGSGVGVAVGVGVGLGEEGTKGAEAGCQLGSISKPSAFVRFTRPVPSGFIAQISPKRRSRQLRKAILVPSGDHFGSLSCSPSKVSRVWFEPSAFIT